MFDAIAGTTARATQRRGTPLLMSMTVHMAVLAGVVIPTLYVVGAPPELPTMMAFVAPLAAPPPPPPPPPAPARTAPERTVARASAAAAPIEAPETITPEPSFEAADVGVPGGVEGGIPGGVVGGIVGGIAEMPPPPPPPPAAPKGPIRVGGQIGEPAVLVRVPPEYPEIAARAQIHGVVILEAMVDEEGAVQDVRVLRSVKFLDQPAIAALRQWRYTPLLLNGEPQPFVLTVSLTFRLDGDAAR